MLVSFWDGLFSGAMLVLGSVVEQTRKPEMTFNILSYNQATFNRYSIVKERYDPGVFAFGGVNNPNHPAK